MGDIALLVVFLVAYVHIIAYVTLWAATGYTPRDIGPNVVRWMRHYDGTIK